MICAVNGFVRAIHKHSQKCLVQIVACFGSFGPISMIQPQKITFQRVNLVYKVLIARAGVKT